MRWPRAPVISVLLAAAALGGCGAEHPDPGRVNLIRNATSSFDRFVTSPTVAEKTLMRTHYWRMRGYPPTFDPALSWAPPSDFYKDLYALYPTSPGDRRLIDQHPDWLLRDARGRSLYVGFDGNRRWPAYAADVGDPAYREAWIAAARTELAKGYAGIFIDNVNMEMRIADSRGTAATPLDPRTGDAMTPEDWQRYVAEFTEGIRAAFPSATITHNALWFAPESNQYVQREILASDYIELERGHLDPGLTGGTGPLSYERYLAHIDWLHEHGIGAVFEPDISDPAQREYEVAGYLLTSNGNDAIASGFQTDPGSFSPSWEVDLGSAQGSRYDWEGVERRDFANGTVLVNEPRAAPVTLDLGSSFRTLEGESERSISLGPATGAVLVKEEG